MNEALLSVGDVIQIALMLAACYACYIRGELKGIEETVTELKIPASVKTDGDYSFKKPCWVKLLGFKFRKFRYDIFTILNKANNIPFFAIFVFSHQCMSCFCSVF